MAPSRRASHQERGLEQLLVGVSPSAPSGHDLSSSTSLRADSAICVPALDRDLEGAPVEGPSAPGHTSRGQSPLRLLLPNRVRQEAIRTKGRLTQRFLNAPLSADHQRDPWFLNDEGPIHPS